MKHINAVARIALSILFLSATTAVSCSDSTDSNNDAGLGSNTTQDGIPAIDTTEDGVGVTDTTTDSVVTADATQDGTVGSDLPPQNDVVEPTIDSLIEGKMDEAHIPGLAAAVIMDGAVYWTGAYGWAHVEDERPVTTDTPFMLASISKTITAVALMQVIEDGLVTLDDNINTHLPFTVDNPRVESETIVVRHLATHTSGIQDEWDNIPYGPGDSSIALGVFLEDYLVPGGDYYHATDNFYAWQPGTDLEYCNVATALAGFLVETVASTGFDDHCDAEIFTPLGMMNTGWHLADFDPNDVAMPYEWDRGDYEPYGQYGFPDYPDGQLRASVNDLARFLVTIMNGGEFGGVRILSEASVNVMLTPQVPTVDNTQFIYWYSEEIGGRTVIGHNGGDDGVATDMFYDPSTGIGVIVLMNTDWTPAVERVAPEIEDSLFDWAESL